MLPACRRYLWLGLLAFTSGCAMCGSCDDETYGAYGGKWERLDPCFGRVGSAFTPEVGTQILSGEVATPTGAAEPVEEAKPVEPQPPEAMPADDASPQPPKPLPDADGKSADASILRYPVRVAR